MRNKFGTVALLFGLISIPIIAAMSPVVLIFGEGNLYSLPPIIVALFTIISWLISSIAFVFGDIGFKRDDSQELASAGYILGLMGLLISNLLMVLLESLNSLF